MYERASLLVGLLVAAAAAAAAPLDDQLLYDDYPVTSASAIRHLPALNPTLNLNSSQFRDANPDPLVHHFISLSELGGAEAGDASAGPSAGGAAAGAAGRGGGAGRGGRGGGGAGAGSAARAHRTRRRTPPAASPAGRHGAAAGARGEYGRGRCARPGAALLLQRRDVFPPEVTSHAPPSRAPQPPSAPCQPSRASNGDIPLGRILYYASVCRTNLIFRVIFFYSIAYFKYC